MHFHNCVGAVDGKLIRTGKPGRSESLCCKCKNYCSVLLLAVADSNFRFVYADAGSNGKDSDACQYLQELFLVAETVAHKTSCRVNSSSALSATLQRTAQLLTSVVAWSCKSKLWRALQRVLHSSGVSIMTGVAMMDVLTCVATAVNTNLVWPRPKSSSTDNWFPVLKNHISRSLVVYYVRNEQIFKKIAFPCLAWFTSRPSRWKLYVPWKHLWNSAIYLKKKLKVKAVAWVREWTIPTKRQPLVDEVSDNFRG
jgi:hypothetical protein